MINTLWNGVSGLSSQQKALDNESNNIANVNTIGYKQSRTSFADQFYQDKIGRGSKVLDAEKIFTNATLKSTGVDYDIALKGDGFFIVTDKRQGGSAQDTYTRAGNFRMGQNGTLQDPIGNEVQAWVMSPIDPDKDVLSTNPNTNIFTKEYKNVVASTIIKHTSSVESIALKVTDYKNTAKADSIVFSGAGRKSIKAKIADVQKAQKNYNYWLDKLKNEPDGPSSSATTQISEINFKSRKTDSVLANKNDQIYVVIDGEKIFQEFVVTNASKEFMKELFDDEPFKDFKKEYGLKTDPSTFTEPLSKEEQEQIETYNILAGRVETYKKLADKISEKPGMVAKTVKEITGKSEDVLENDDIYRESTKIKDILKGIIQIKSLIPGVELRISDVGEISAKNSSSKGNILTSSFAKQGKGLGALESARQALIDAIIGKEEDVYSPIDLNLDDAPIYTYSILIYDKELKKNIPVPNNNANPLQPVPILINSLNQDGKSTIDAFIKSFKEEGQKSSPKLTDYVEAININNHLVIRTLDKNIDVEFSANLKQLSAYTINLNEIVDNSKYTFDLNINGNYFPIEIDYKSTNELNNNAEYTNIRQEIVEKINEINKNNPDYHLGVTEQKNGIFSIYMKNEEVDFSDSNILINDTLPIVGPLKKKALAQPLINYERDKIIITKPVLNQVYSFTIMGQTISYDNTTGNTSDPDEILEDISNQIKNNPTLSPYVEAKNHMGSSSDGIILSNDLNKTVQYGSSPIGRYMIEIPAGTRDLTLYLDEYTLDDTLQIFTKDGKHIFGTNEQDKSWKDGNSPKNIVTNNPKYFNHNAQYVDKLQNPTVTGTYYGPYNSETGFSNNPANMTTVNYIDKKGNPQTKTIFESEEMIVIPNVNENLVVFVNGIGSYQVSAEWASNKDANSASMILQQKDTPDQLNPEGLNITNMQGIGLKELEKFKATPINEHRFTLDTSDDKSSSVYVLRIEGKEFEFKTDQTPTLDEILEGLNDDLEKDAVLNEKFNLSLDGNDLVIRPQKGEFGLNKFTQNSQLKVRSLTEPYDEYKTALASISQNKVIDTNTYHSGRSGANAELLEIKTNVDQLSTKDSLQLRFDNLHISDSSFGKFDVDNTGLVTIEQNGIKIAVGQVAIARFANNRALEAIGDNLFVKTTESGDPMVKTNNDGLEGIKGKSLELSSADLSESLVNLMIFQRAFEANAKTITTSDQILNALINIKR